MLFLERKLVSKLISYIRYSDNRLIIENNDVLIIRE